MFVKFCPDPSLASMFRCKPVQEWSAKEIQSRIDDYQREFRSWGNSTANLRSHTTAVFSSEHVMQDCPKTESPSVPVQSFSSLPDTARRQPEPTPAPSQAQLQPSSCSTPAPGISQHTQQAESHLLTRMMEMMEQLMGRMQFRDVPNPRRGPRQQRGFVRNACRVCNDSKHTTVTHCMTEKLCFSCFSPGHTKKDCPIHSSAHTQQEGN